MPSITRWRRNDGEGGEHEERLVGLRQTWAVLGFPDSDGGVPAFALAVQVGHGGVKGVKLIAGRSG